MTDYTKLVEALTCDNDGKLPCHNNECPYWVDKWHGIGLCNVIKKDADAADAIEALQAEVDTLKRTDSKRCQECLYLGQPVGEQQMPKLGKWIDDEFTSKGRCSVCGEEWSWFDNCMETFKYCPNCGAKMMEVQE